MDVALRAQYLEHLGVLSYVPRVDVPFHWEGPKDAALVFLFQSNGDILDWSSATLQLLQKIMDAVRTPTCSMALCFAPSLSSKLPIISKHTRIIAFGKSLADKVSFLNTIETLPLAILQGNEAAKRVLWEALKEVKRIYA